MEELTVTPKEQTEIQVIANNINDGLKAFEEKKSELTKLKEDAAGLTIESIEDKESIKKVATWRKTLKAARVEIQKQGKAMRDPLTKISKSISAKEDELIDIISPTEKDLQEKEDWVESEKKKLAEAEEARKQAIIQQRIDKLAAFGFAIDIIFLQGLDEAQFEKVLANAQTEFEKEEAKKADELRLEQEKQAQIEKDLADLAELRKKQAEADRIIKERQDELDRQSKLLKQQQEEAEIKEFQRIKVEKDAVINNRIDQMVSLGLSFDFSDDHYKGFGCFVPVLDIKCHSVEQWDEMVSKLTVHIVKVKEDESKKAEEKRLKDIEDAKQQAIADEKERQRLQIKKEADEKAAAELKKEQELALSKDKVKYQDTIDYLLKVPIHEMRSGTYRAKMKVIRDFLDGLK